MPATEKERESDRERDRDGERESQGHKRGTASRYFVYDGFRGEG